MDEREALRQKATVSVCEPLGGKMATGYSVQRLALHFIDRTQDEPDFGEGEVNLASYESAGHGDVLSIFFEKYLDEVWRKSESGRTVAASFRDDSALRKVYKDIIRDEETFFGNSCEIARLLHKSSKGRSATPGLLMIIWVLAEGCDYPFLVMFKILPEENKVLALRQGKSKDVILLDIVVQTIAHALPEPGDRILKWAVVRHPTRLSYDLKVHDETSTPIAQYFLDFLGCDRRPNEKKQRVNLLKAVTEYAEEIHGSEKGRQLVSDALSVIPIEGTVTPAVVIEAFRRSDPDFNEALLLERLENADVSEFDVSARSLRETKIRYLLVGGKICIEGPRDLMEELVEITETGNETEFRIRTATYEKEYK